MADATAGESEATIRVARPPRLDAPTRCLVCGHGPLIAGAACPRCAEERTDALVVDGRYRVESELGRGGMGVVYLARDTWLGRPVALKMIEPSWAATSPAAVESFLREARALASIRNEHVVQVYAFGLHDGAQFFAMEYVRGRNLRQILEGHREHGDTIPVHRTLTIVKRVAQGIDAVHEAGIVHRDVKPTNVVIEEHTGRPVLLDFGLAVHGEQSLAVLQGGSPQYMAPEQIGLAGAARINERTDVYALGVTSFEMLVGRLPFPTTDFAQLMRSHTRKKPPLLSSIRKDLIPFDPVLSRALAKDPDERHPSATAFADELTVAGERWIKGTLPTLPPPPEAAPPWIDSSLPPPAAPVSRPQSEPRLTAVEPAPVLPRRVLVVDDSPVFRKFAVQAVHMAFYRCRRSPIVVEGACSGEDALDRAAENPPDLVLLDFDMPGLDGVNTLSILRALPDGDRTRVVVVSGRVRPADRWRFAAMGVNDFVIKPIDFRQLVDRIEGIARRIEERDTFAG